MEDVDNGLLKKVRISKRAFTIILITLFLIAIVLIVYSRTCCDESEEISTDCQQIQWDYSCCKVKNFWNPFNYCKDKYLPFFEEYCVVEPVWDDFELEVGLE